MPVPSTEVSPTAVADTAPVFELPDIAVETVFIVDDQKTVLDGMERALTRSGYNVRSFGAPGDALAELSEGTPKVMVTDNNMPGITGLELAQKALELDPKMRIVVLTGGGDERTAQAALRLGLSDYLVKRVGVPELTAAVQKAFVDHARDEYAETMDSWLREEVERQTSLVREVTLGAMASLVNALEARSPHFAGHSQSVAISAVGIARELGLPNQEA